MGRAHLSSQYGIDDDRDAELHHHHHQAVLPTSPSVVSQLPKFLERPFDLDATLPDGPDVVYEAFLTPDEIRQREDTNIVAVPARNSAPSPVESIDTDEGTSEAPTEPVTRVPSPAEEEEDRGRSSPSAATTSERSPSVSPGSRVLQLLEPLSDATTAALPALRTVVEEVTSGTATTTTDMEVEITPLVRRLISIVRPHITMAVAPFRSSMPDVDVLGHMFVRSLILDVLSVDPPLVSPAALRAALDAAEGLLFEEGTAENADGELEDEDDGDEDEDDAVSDPGMDEEDLMAEASSTTTRGQSIMSPITVTSGNVGWSTPSNSSRATSLVNRIPRPTTIISSRSRSTTPMEVDDTSDDALSNGPGPTRSSISVYHRAAPNPSSFSPRIIRANHNHGHTRPGPYPALVSTTGGRGFHDRFVPVDRLRATSPPR